VSLSCPHTPDAANSLVLFGLRARAGAVLRFGRIDALRRGLTLRALSR
jgi:hypothetical protein